jgi:hypothetical protein
MEYRIVVLGLNGLGKLPSSEVIVGELLGSSFDMGVKSTRTEFEYTLEPR